MSQYSQFFVFVSLLVLISISRSQGQELTAIISNAKLPLKLLYTSSIYDGNDTIYIFGGKATTLDDRYGSRSPIYTYSIATDTISKIRSMDYTRYGAAISMGSNGNIYYTGGEQYVDSPRNIIYEYIPTTNSWTVAKYTTPLDNCWSPALRYNSSSDIMFIIGGAGSADKLKCYNMADNSFCSGHNTVLPPELWNSNMSAVSHDGFAYLFMGDGVVQKVNMGTWQMIETGTIPVLDDISTAVLQVETPEGPVAYVIGGWQNSSAPTNGILKIILSSLVGSVIPIKDYPAGKDGDGSYLTGASAVYVQKKDRIYIIGGQVTKGDSDERVIQDTIWWIDLSPDVDKDPLPFNCDDKPIGMYPYPSNRALYVGCIFGSVEVFKCPYPLVFDGTEARCDFE